MVRESEVREGELTVDMPPAKDAGLVFIGRIRTPWKSRLETPRQGRHDGPVCRLEIFEPWVPAIKGVDFYSNLEVLYWLHQSRRDFVLQSPKNNGNTRGTFSLRSPVRPNPIGTSIVKLVGVEGNVVLVRGLDCLDETPLIGPETRPLRIHAAGDAAGRRFRDGVISPSVIARSKATKQSTLSLRGDMDCFASLAMTVVVIPRCEPSWASLEGCAMSSPFEARKGAHLRDD